MLSTIPVTRGLRHAALSLVCVLAAATANARGIAKGPYLQNPTTAGVTVCWVSDAPVMGAVVVDRSGPTTTTVRETAPAVYHRVTVKGLKPYTHYGYTVTCDGDTGSGTLLTAAPPNQPFHFIAYGDNRTQPEVHARVLRQMSKFDPDFVLQTGDLVADGRNERLWDEFFRVAGAFMRNVAYFPALGNHEGEASPYFRYFPVQREYSFDYGNTHFVALDTNRPANENAAQEAWLRDDLAKHQKATWRVVYFHHTMHTCVSIPDRRRQAAVLNARLAPILKAGRVQLVVNGHDHNYQHHYADGIHYLVTGGGGAPLYALKPDTPFVKKALTAYNDCEITVNGPTMSIRAVQPDGSVIEQFQIQANR